MDIFISYFNEYGIIIIALFIILEYSCFPLPSEIILPAAGAFALLNNINVFLMIIISIICSLIGCLICYIIGYGGNNLIIKRIIKKQKNELNQSIITYNKYKNIGVCIGRMIPLCRTYISFIAGLNKHNILSFLTFSAIGIAIWNTLLILLGYNFFNNIEVISHFYNNYKKIIIFCFVILILILVIKTLIKKLKNAKILNGE